MKSNRAVEWNEADHSRDEDGKFTSGSGHVSSHAQPLPTQGVNHSSSVSSGSGGSSSNSVSGARTNLDAQHGTGHSENRIEADTNVRRMPYVGGRALGRFATDEEIEKERQILRSAGMNIQVGTNFATGLLDHFNAAGLFALNPRDSRRTVFLRKNATFYELKHECLHAEQCRKLGGEKFDEQTQLEGEQYVFDRLMELHKNKEIVLNTDEMQHAIDTIEIYKNAAKKNS